MNPYSFSLLFFSFCTFFISILIWLKRQDVIGKFYFFFSQFAVIWSLGFAIMISSDVSYETAHFCSRFLNASAIFLTATWFHFTLIYTKRTQLYRKTLIIIYLLSIGVNCFSYTQWFIPELRPLLGFKHYSIPGPIFHFFPVFYFTVVPLGFIQLFQKMKDLNSDERVQLKGFTIATGSAFLGGALTFLPCYGILIPPYVLFLFPIYPFAMAYFMTREQLFDVEQAMDAFRRDKLAAIGTLAASMNHEIKNPLFIIRGLTETHLSKFDGTSYKESSEIIEKSNETLRRVHEHAVRAMDIMKRFSSFAKQTHAEVPSKTVLHINDVLAGVMPLVRHELELKNIEFVSTVPQNLSQLNLDMRDSEEIFFNLIVNAVQAIKNRRAADSEQGSVLGRIEIAAEQVNGWVTVAVKDNGPGIPEKKLKQIFDPFYTTKTEGTGLGLYITRQLVERNGGKIEVKSKLGCGTIFKLRFPCIEQVFQPSLTKMPCLSSPNLLIGDPLN